MDHVQKNYRWNEEDVEKGFIQGILLCCKALADKEPDKLPKRYMEALKRLANDSSVVITQADKGGGIVTSKTPYVAIDERGLVRSIHLFLFSCVH